MADPLIYPDYGSSIVNLMASVEQALGARPPHAPLPELDPRSLADRTVVVVMVMDGLGSELLAANASPSSFLRSHAGAAITSVYPSTTASAVTSLMSGMTPLEHGALGWELFFREFGRYIDFLPFRDSVSGTQLYRKELGMERVLRVRNLFERVAARGVETFYLGPRFIVRDQFADESSEPARRVGSRSLAGLCRDLVRIVRRTPRRAGRRPRFVFCYHSDPDHTAHRKGTSAPETAAVVARIDQLMEGAARRLAGSGATVIVTADHGLVDTPVHHWLDEDTEVYRSLILPPFPEKRFLSFFVKGSRREVFPELMRRYERDFVLLTREELLARGILGKGQAHPKVDDFLGDFLALATGAAQMHTRIAGPKREHKQFVAHHAGLTRQEMLVPLIRVDT